MEKSREHPVIMSVDIIQPNGIVCTCRNVERNRGEESISGKTNTIHTRKFYMDYLRVIATVFVIGVHTVSLASSMSERGSMTFKVLECFDFFFLSCNLLFIMISGALLLPVQGESIGTFFKKRFTKVAIPLVVYYILYVCAKEGIEWIYPNHWFAMLQRIFTGAPNEAPHFWLVYVILWLYVLTPFLRWLLKNIPDGVFCGVMAVIFVVCALDTYLPLMGITSHLGWFTDSFVGAFLLGYLLDGKCSRKAEHLFLAGGAVSLVCSCYWIVGIGENYEDYLYNNSPAMILLSAAIFLTVKRLAKEWRTPAVITFLGKYSYSILLIHWGVLHFAVKQLLSVDVLSGGIWGGCLLMMGLTLALSAAGAFVLEQILLRWLELPFRKSREKSEA